MTVQTVQTERPYKVWRMLVNDTEAAPELVYHEPDEAFFLSLSLTHSRQHILLHGESHATHYISTLSAANPTSKLQMLVAVAWARPSVTSVLSELHSLSRAGQSSKLFAGMRAGIDSLASEWGSGSSEE